MVSLTSLINFFWVDKSFVVSTVKSHNLVEGLVCAFLNLSE